LDILLETKDISTRVRIDKCDLALLGKPELFFQACDVFPI
jgi:hypothetical protein